MKQFSHNAPAVFMAVACVTLAACDVPEEKELPGVEPGPQATVPIDAIRVSPNAPEGVAIAAADVQAYLARMGTDLPLERSTRRAACSDGGTVIEFVGDGLGDRGDFQSDQGWRVEEERCGGGRRVTLDGGGSLGRQYAAYAFLHELGVRFFHPEEEFVPTTAGWPEEPIAIDVEPAFRFRSVTLHLTHPLELGDPLRLGVASYSEEVRNYIDWQIKNYASVGLVGSDFFPHLADYGHRRGLPRSVGFDLHNQQQDYRGVVDPDSPLPWRDQIARAIDARMGSDPDDYPEQFHFTFNPSEFTELPDELIVDQLTFIADYMAMKYPRTILMTTNHGTAGEPTENYEVRYYDLPQFAPENLGVKVHTLMFYDLVRPAPVYGNENFHAQFDFIAEQSEVRRIWHYPESAWWLTFDIAIPQYLPITIEARDRDLQAIAPFLADKLDGHRVFGSGHEWGYWQNEYCSFRMAVDLDYRWNDCVADIASVAGDDADEVAAAVESIVELQQEHWFDPDVIRWLAGSDDETELALQIGIDFHPLAPRPATIARWDAAEIERWDDELRPRLESIAAAYEPIVSTLRGIEEAASEDARPWISEIADGTEVNLLRARHAALVHDAVVVYRKRQLGLDVGDSTPEGLLREAELVTVEVSKITRSRSEDFRYTPKARAIGPATEDGTDVNWTGYPYRYLHRAHHAFYFKRTNRLAAEVIEGSGAPVEVSGVLVELGEVVRVDVLDDELTEVAIDLGDGTSSAERSVEHNYTSTGVYRVRVAATRGESPFEFEFDVAVAASRDHGVDGQLIAPDIALAGQIEAVLPGFLVGIVDDDTIVAGTTADEDPVVAVGSLLRLEREATSMRFATAPKTLQIPLAVGGADSEVGFTIQNGRFVGEDGGFRLFGDMSTDAVIEAIVELSGGAFDRPSAEELVAKELGFTVDTLPETVPFEVLYPSE